MNTAVALRYPTSAAAPFIVAKGKDLLAEKMIELAQAFSVPITKDAVLTNVLSVYDVGEYVPPETYEVLANIFAFVARTPISKLSKF